MNVSIGDRWESFVNAVVKSGRYSSASEVVREGLRLVEEREAKLISLRETIQASLAENVFYTEEEVDEHLEGVFTKLAEEGY
ncbi:MAG: type II toxin-antitoxin system ParD family antitoxin [Novosphingobium sp.]|uniref:type II toxin-antitoxin system ParD family antitoxin n=1 Tax=Novosphingobium sp. TaxID=1874826 RepID=UPI0030187BD4